MFKRNKQCPQQAPAVYSIRQQRRMNQDAYLSLFVLSLSMHRSHDLPPAVYAGTRLIIAHWMLNYQQFSFKFQAYTSKAPFPPRTLRSSTIFCGCYTAL